MKLELEYELITDDFGPRVELALVDPEHQRRRVIFCEYPNPGHRRGVGVSAFNLVATRLEKALSENPCR